MFRNLMDCVHLTTQAEQVNRDDGTEFFAALGFQIAIRISLAIFLDAFLNCGCADVIGDRIDIDEKRFRANARDAASGCEKCVRRGDDGIAASDAERHQNGQESICPGGNTDRMRCIAIRTDRFLEGLQLRPKNETLANQDGVDCLADWFSQAAVLFS